MPDGLRYILYARKSTRRKDRQVLSIPRQLAELRSYAERDSLSVVAEYIERETASKPGRPEFNKVLDQIRNGYADAILAWSPDRLCRNSFDHHCIISLLDQNILKTIKFPTFTFENTPSGKLMLSLMLLQSKYFSDDLSAVTKGGFREKIRRGEYPGRAKFGYWNDAATKTIKVDRSTAPIVREMFSRYATGAETLDTMRELFADRGILTANGKRVCRSRIAHILRDPFYYGHFKRSGELYRGVHSPLITKHLFDRVQAVLESRWRWSDRDPRWRRSTPKAFTRLLRCATCGCAITAERQKGHIYYRCSRKNPAIKCKEPYVREGVLDQEVSRLLSDHFLIESAAADLRAFGEADAKASCQSSESTISNLEREVEAILSKLAAAFSLVVPSETSVYSALRARLGHRYVTIARSGNVDNAARSKDSEPLHVSSPTIQALLRSFKKGDCALLTGQGQNCWTPRLNDGRNEDQSVLLAAIFSKKYHPSGTFKPKSLEWVLGVAANRPDTFNEEHKALMRCMADQLGSVLNVMVRFPPASGQGIPLQIAPTTGQPTAA